jgi:hypothetical protein
VVATSTSVALNLRHYQHGRRAAVFVLPQPRPKPHVPCRSSTLPPAPYSKPPLRRRRLLLPRRLHPVRQRIYQRPRSQHHACPRAAIANDTPGPRPRRLNALWPHGRFLHHGRSRARAAHGHQSPASRDHHLFPLQPSPPLPGRETLMQVGTGTRILAWRAACWRLLPVH